MNGGISINKIRFYFSKYKFYIIIYSFLILIFISIFNKKNYSNAANADIIKSESITVETDDITVDIKGLVENPGVYNVKNGTRVIDIISLAGGLKEGANTDQINLSKKVVDEMVINITSKEETSSNNNNDASNGFEDAIYTNNFSYNTISDDKISINTSSKEELMSLSGIGESKAESIIKYRETTGLFNSIEEIMNVSGIGESVYKKIKNNIKL